jgi:DNA polymerase/3'-5' exonuclease PolX
MIYLFFNIFKLSYYTVMNNKIIDQFKLLTEQIKFDIRNTSGKIQMIHMYRLKSINVVIDILEKYPKKIKKADQLIGIKNIGEKSIKRIDEILKTGKLSEIIMTNDEKKYSDIIKELENIIGVGQKKAYDLIKKHKITSISDLKKKHKSGKIILPNNIIKGLKYIDKIKKNIPRNEIYDFNFILTDLLKKINPKLIGLICGSYRREKSTSNDIDFIITHKNIITPDDIHNNKHNYLNEFINILKSKQIIIDSLTSEKVPTKYMGIVKLNSSKHLRRLDIRYVPYESFFTAVLYFTGSKNLNKKMRMVAMNMGYTLNEYGLFNEKGKMFKITSEKDVFKKLNMEYLTPDKRI